MSVRTRLASTRSGRPVTCGRHVRGPLVALVAAAVLAGCGGTDTTAGPADDASATDADSAAVPSSASATSSPSADTPSADETTADEAAVAEPWRLDRDATISADARRQFGAADARAAADSFLELHEREYFHPDFLPYDPDQLDCDAFLDLGIAMTDRIDTFMRRACRLLAKNRLLAPDERSKRMQQVYDNLSTVRHFWPADLYQRPIAGPLVSDPRLDDVRVSTVDPGDGSPVVAVVRGRLRYRVHVDQDGKSRRYDLDRYQSLGFAPAPDGWVLTDFAWEDAN